MPNGPTCIRAAYKGMNGITMPKPSRSIKTVRNRMVRAARRLSRGGVPVRASALGIDLNRAMKQILCGRRSQARVRAARDWHGETLAMRSGMAAELKSKTVAADAAAAAVKSGDWIDYGFGVGQPDLIDQALAARIATLRDVKLRGTLALRARAAVEADPEGRHLTYLSWYFSGLERKLHDRNLCHHIPMNFGEAPGYYRRFIDVDVAMVKTAPMDEHGFFNFGGAVTYHKALTEKARIVIVETEPAMPYVFGVENGVHLSDVDYVVEAGAGGLPGLRNPPAGPLEQKIG